ncbi:MAG: tagaturonate epimerase family protein [Spirochaetota bacterium]
MDALAKLVVEHDLLNLSQSEIDAMKPDDDDADLLLGAADGALYTRSLQVFGNALVGIARVPAAGAHAAAVTGPAGSGGAGGLSDAAGPAARAGYEKRLVVYSPEPVRLGFHGPTGLSGAVHYQEVVPSGINLGPLWEHFPWTRPASLRNERTTIGMGDRIGMASAGHIRAARKFNVSPVLAQQSTRELDFTARSFTDVVADAAFLVFQEGYQDGYGADGDHLKTIPDIDRALANHMPMITLDLTEVMKPEVADWSDAEVEQAFGNLAGEFRRRVEDRYAGKSAELETARVEIDAPTARRCAVMYGDALAFSETVNAHLKHRTGDAYDLEISIDETTTPTLPSHHYFIARELEVRGVTVNSLAPRFIGDFQKGIDYIGDLDEFTRQFRVHAEIARATGGYKVSVHSGSDKFSVYPVVGEQTQMRLHLKTSGTSWLESLRTIAQTEPELYRSIHRRAIDYFPIALGAYHITADVDSIAPLEQATDAELPDYLNDPNCRQLLHISYGGLLRDPDVRERYFAALHLHEEQHTRNVRDHLMKHMELLGAVRR